MKVQNGFSLIEVIIAMLILTVAVLAMGASTGFILAQVRGAELRTEQMMSLRQASETMRSVTWDQLATECGNLALEQDDYSVGCNYTLATPNLARLQLISVGPGYTGAGPERADTVVLHIPRP